MQTHRQSLQKFTIADRRILDKKVKNNPKYEGITSRTNSGFNTQRRRELEREIRKYYKVRERERE